MNVIALVSQLFTISMSISLEEVSLWKPFSCDLNQSLSMKAMDRAQTTSGSAEIRARHACRIGLSAACG
jgi:hypothetical protein